MNRVVIENVQRQSFECCDLDIDSKSNLSNYDYEWPPYSTALGICSEVQQFFACSPNYQNFKFPYVIVMPNSKRPKESLIAEKKLRNTCQIFLVSSEINPY